jgi:hypothetical protein
MNRLTIIWNFSLLIIGAAPFLSTVAISQPIWAKSNTQSRHGNIFKVVCDGTGPALDLARKDALQSCRNSAMSQLQTNLEVKSTIIETESGTAYHQETVQNAKYSGLDCSVEKEAVEETDGESKVYLLCKFDLSEAKVTSVSAVDGADINENSKDSDLVKNRSNLGTIADNEAEIATKDFVKSENRQLVLTTIPRCDDLLIRGQRPRIVKCDEMPKSVFLYGNDTEIIVRAKGYLPKHVELNQRKPASDGASESLEVFLEKP